MSDKRSEICDLIIQIFIEKLGIKIDNDSFSKTYLELGINSILFVKLLISIEVALDFEFEEDIINIGQGYTLDDLVTYVLEKKNNYSGG